MLWVPPPEPSPKAPSCVIDVGLSLAPTGLYWVLGLARAVPVYLPQCHFAIVDDKEFPIDERLATHLAGAPDFADASAILARVRHDWREARDRIGFESCPNLYWPMDGRSDSVLPKDGDTSLVDRLHILAAGSTTASRSARTAILARPTPSRIARATRSPSLRPSVTASRSSSPLCRDDGGEPLIAAHLARAGIPCSRVARSRFTEAVGSMLVPAMLASGLAVRLASGRLRLGRAVRRRAWRARRERDGRASRARATTTSVGIRHRTATEAALWDDATAVWWELA